jgi:hypothetical protein
MPAVDGAAAIATAIAAAIAAAVVVAVSAVRANAVCVMCSLGDYDGSKIIEGSLRVLKIRF